MNRYNIAEKDVVKDLIWSGNSDIPEIGDRVRVTVNDFGVGSISAYFTECGYLGVEVKLDNPPEWYLVANEGVDKWWAKDNRVLVFGGEIEKGDF